MLPHFELPLVSSVIAPTTTASAHQADRSGYIVASS
jgi:hypothetical protein